MNPWMGSADDPAAQPGGLRALSAGGFARLGLGSIAYIRPIVIEQTAADDAEDAGADAGRGTEHAAYAVHAADGTPIAIAATWELACAVARQNVLQPLSVH